MEYVVPLVRDKNLLVSTEGIAVMTKHMCEKGNGTAAIVWLLTCRGAGSTIDQRQVESRTRAICTLLLLSYMLLCLMPRAGG